MQGLIIKRTGKPRGHTARQPARADGGNAAFRLSRLFHTEIEARAVTHWGREATFSWRHVNVVGLYSGVNLEIITRSSVMRKRTEHVLWKAILTHCRPLMFWWNLQIRNTLDKVQQQCTIPSTGKQSMNCYRFILIHLRRFHDPCHRLTSNEREKSRGLPGVNVLT